ncbi:MAG: SPOR domain-containing protein [Rhodospirillales bacterium]|nr:SPOR domain-containing protein [Rhodospirillales bacterium]
MAERKPIHFSPRQPPFPDPNELAVESQPQSRRGRGSWVIAALLVIALVFAWWGWNGEDEQVAGVEPEVIRADPEPVKVKPDEPGGMTVEDRDKLVYRRLAGEEEPDTVERLLPPTEEPIAPPQPQLHVESDQPPPPPAWLAEDSERVNGQASQPDDAAPAGPADPSTSGNGNAAATGVGTAAPTSRPARDDQRAESAAGSAAPADSAQPSDAGRAPEVSTAAVSAPPASTRGGVYQIQLAAVSSEERAESAWAGYKAKHGDLLGDLGSQVVRADLGDKGVFYRLRAGPILGENNARALCNRLSGRGVGCMVVRPGG